MDSISIRGYLVVAYLERSVLTLSNFFRCFFLVREFSKSVLQIIHFFWKNFAFKSSVDVGGYSVVAYFGKLNFNSQLLFQLLFSGK